MTTPATSDRFSGRAASRREVLLNQLALACNDGEVPLDYKQDTSGPDRGTMEEKPVLPDPPDDNEAYRLIAPPALMQMAAPHYTAFWRDIQQLEGAHRNTCLAAFKATQDVSASVELPGEIDGLEGLLSSVRACAHCSRDGNSPTKLAKAHWSTRSLPHSSKACANEHVDRTHSDPSWNPSAMSGQAMSLPPSRSGTSYGPGCRSHGSYPISI